MKLLLAIFICCLFFLPAATAYEIESQRGDIAVWMFLAVSPGDELYIFQTQVTSYEAKISKLKLLEPFWEFAEFWDDTDYPLGARAFCGHIQPLDDCQCISDELCQVPYILVLLRPTEKVKNILSVDKLLKFYDDIFNKEDNYKIPFFDVEEFYYNYVADFAPMKHETQEYSQYINVMDPAFFDRYYNCASATAWGLLCAWYENSDDTGKQEILSMLNVDTVRSIDLVTPGFLCHWLVSNKLYEIVNIIDFGEK